MLSDIPMWLYSAAKILTALTNDSVGNEKMSNEHRINPNSSCYQHFTWTTILSDRPSLNMRKIFIFFILTEFLIDFLRWLIHQRFMVFMCYRRGKLDASLSGKGTVARLRSSKMSPSACERACLPGLSDSLCTLVIIILRTINWCTPLPDKLSAEDRSLL